MKNKKSARPRPKSLPQGFKPSVVARALGLPRSTVYSLIKSRELPAVRYGRQGLIVLATDLREFLAKRRKD